MPGLKTEPGIARLPGAKAIWFKDPDGNILNVFERE
jgi:catechol-2,3-dioxygenase